VTDAAAPPVADPAVPSARARRPDDALAVAAVALLGVGAVVGAAQVWRTGWTPSADQAFIELRVRDVPGDPPLLGVFSRYGWSHPGPALFYLLAVPYRLAGGASEALAVAALAAQVLVVAVTALLARRLDRVAGVTVLVALQVVLLTAGAAATRDPWNPFVPLVASGLLVVCAWGTGERRRMPAALLVPTATVLVQSHAAAGTLAVASLVLAGIALWWSGRDQLPDGAVRRPVPWAPLGAGAAVGALMWLPPVIAQLTGEPGRIGELFSAGTGVGARAGLSGAVGALTHAFALVPDWAAPGTARAPFSVVDPTVPVWWVVPVLGAVVAARSGRATLLRGVVVSSACTLAVALGIAAFEVGDLGGVPVVFGYLTVALRATAATTVAIGVAALSSGAPDRIRAGVGTAGGVAAVALGIAFVVAQTSTAVPEPGLGATIRALGSAVTGSVPPGSPLVLVEPISHPGAEGVALQLERAGFDVAVADPTVVTRFGPGRLVDDLGGRTEVLVAGVDRAPALRAEGWTVVSICPPGADGPGPGIPSGLVALRGPASTGVVETGCRR
jgi:hypothetical protein